MKEKEVVFLFIGILLLTYLVSAEKAPKIEIEETIYACEGEALRYIFSGGDIDGENLSADINLKDPFYVRELNGYENSSLKKFEIFSGKLNKNESGRVYRARAFVSDGKYSDGKDIEIKVVEINNPPSMSDLETITIDLERSNVLSKQVEVRDVEDGTQNNGKIVFNLSFISGKRIFGIDKNGLIGFYVNSSHVGNYNIKICARDLGIDNIDKKINLCGQDGKSLEACKEFWLTIIEKNRKPTIVSKWPQLDELNIRGNESKQIEFNITAFDPDGTKLGVRWIVNGKLVEKNELKYFYKMSCENKTEVIRAEVTDGLEMDQIQWVVRGNNITCVNESALCESKLGCGEWGLCQRALQSAEIGVLSDEDYDEIKRICGRNEWADANCGYQTRNCKEFSECKNEIGLTPEIRTCYFTYNPSCTDGIKNCHNNKCEELVDCGGACVACASCYDGLKNGEELGVDCGEDCEKECEIYEHFYDRKGAKYTITVGILLLIALIVFVARKIIYIKKETEGIPAEKLK